MFSAWNARLYSARHLSESEESVAEALWVHKTRMGHDGTTDLNTQTMAQPPATTPICIIIGTKITAPQCIHRSQAEDEVGQKRSPVGEIAGDQ